MDLADIINKTYFWFLPNFIYYSLLYDSKTNKYFWSLEHNAGITQVVFDDHYAIVGCRNDTQVYLWDLRNTDCWLGTFYRNSLTSQRMYFGYSNLSKTLFLGSLDGSILKYSAKDLSFQGQSPLMFDWISCVSVIDHFKSQELDKNSNSQNYTHLLIVGSGTIFQ